MSIKQRKSQRSTAEALEEVEQIKTSGAAHTNKFNYEHGAAHTIMLLIKLFRIGPVTGPGLAVLDRGRRPRSNTADRGPVTGPI